MFDQPLTRLTFVSLIAVSMVSCGQRGPTTAESFQAYPIATATPTLSPLDQTQQAIDERIEQEMATAAALPTLAVLEPLPTDLPLEPLQTGLDTDCETIYSRLIITTNCWLDIVNDEYVFFVAGSEPDTAPQGKVGLYTVSLDETTTSDFFAYQTPQQKGAVTITDITVPRFTVTAEDGTRFVFNLDTRTWED
ncbi:MAG: hypothetical protein GFH26_640309n53, partial [Chloroflexi bacterium AL-N15]|nr:hypothetical protein [Chloroflexi bacterium AL-N15]